MEQVRAQETGFGVGDEVLVARIARGETQLFGELFTRHSSRVRRLILSVLGPTDQLDDLTQEVFVNLHRAIPQFEGKSQFSSWLHRITVNTAITYLRKPRRILVSLSDATLDPPDKDHVDAYGCFIGKEMVRRLYDLLEGMKEKRRVAFTLFAIQGCSIAQVADMLGVSQAVVKSRIWFAKQELKKKAAKDPFLAPLLEEMTP